MQAKKRNQVKLQHRRYNTTRILNEGLDYHDLVGQLEPTVSVDEYKAKMGKDSDVVTLAFYIKSEAAGDDLVNWF